MKHQVAVHGDLIMVLFRSFKVVLDVDHITERSFVVQQIQRQARAGKRKEMILAQGLSKDVSVLYLCTVRLVIHCFGHAVILYFQDWAVFAQKMKTFLEEMRTNYREKVPIEAIGMQVGSENSFFLSDNIDQI